MKRIKFLAVVLVSALIMGGCGQKSADLQDNVVPPDTELFENGMESLEKNQYIKARLFFQTLINTYADSEYTPTAFLGIADSYYDEGGTENLLQAEAQYKDFLIFYPTHEMADDAQLKIAAINVRLMRPYDRDPTYARKARAELRRFLDNYPDSEYSPTAREFLHMVEETLAKGHHEVGEFYFSRDSFLAAEDRYQEVLSEFPNFSGTDETLFKAAKALENQGRIDEAVPLYHRLAEEFPFSDYFEEAREMLVLLERPVPEVNEEKAAQNEANLREGDFSVFDPIRSLWQVFAGQPDIYEIARKRLEENESQELSTGDLPPDDQ